VDATGFSDKIFQWRNILWLNTIGCCQICRNQGRYNNDYRA
jgi:hypothetical protein